MTVTSFFFKPIKIKFVESCSVHKEGKATVLICETSPLTLLCTDWQKLHSVCKKGSQCNTKSFVLHYVISNIAEHHSLYDQNAFCLKSCLVVWYYCLKYAESDSSLYLGLTANYWKWVAYHFECCCENIVWECKVRIILVWIFNWEILSL